MTTTVTPPALSDRVLRIPTIAANLLPAEIIDARRTRKIRLGVVAGLAAVVVLLAGWYVVAAYQTSAARDDLANRQSEAQVLVREQHAYANLIQVQAQSHAIEAQLRDLFSADVEWAPLVGHVYQALPSQVGITAINAAGGSDKTSHQPAGSVTANPDQIGSITITGSAPTKNLIATYVDNLAKVPGLSNPYLANVGEIEGGYDYTIRVDIVKTALGGRYSSPVSSSGSQGTGG